MRKRYLLGAVVVVLASSSLPIACGGDGADEVDAFDEDVIAKADFIQAANAACQARIKQMKAKSRRVFAKASEKSPQAGAKLLIEQVVVPGFEGELRDLRALQPPPGDEARVEQVIDAIQEMVDRTQRDLGQGRPYPYRKTENLTAAYGLPDCGHP